MRISLGTAALALCVGATAAFAAPPEKPECVAPAKPGGGFDLTCRIAASALESQLGRPMAVTFMPGGIGAVAFNEFNSVRTNDPNAIVALSTGSALNIGVGKFGQWTANDAKFVASAGADYGAVIVKADSPYKTLGDLMGKLKGDPGSLVIGAGGSVGSQDWMKAALLIRSVGGDAKKMRYVAFDGGGESIAALLGGSIQVYTGDVSEMKAHLGAGTMRILAVLADKRLPAPYAEFATAKEQGFDVVWTIWRGFYMGKSVSDEAYNWYADAFKKAYATPEYAKIREEKGLFEFSLAGKEFDDYVKASVETMRGIAKEAGLIK